MKYKERACPGCGKMCCLPVQTICSDCSGKIYFARSHLSNARANSKIKVYNTLFHPIGYLARGAYQFEPFRDFMDTFKELVIACSEPGGTREYDYADDYFNLFDYSTVGTADRYPLKTNIALALRKVYMELHELPQKVYDDAIKDNKGVLVFAKTLQGNLNRMFERLEKDKSIDVDEKEKMEAIDWTDMEER